jgi:nitrogen-specific signal transduction histidine kinase/CheY-like chemotaxis protein
MRDITELKRAEADRLILNKLESTGILAGGIAHDFNNLLTAILLNLELAQMLAPPGGELERYLEEARKSGRLARSLTAQLVTFSGGGTPIRRAMLLSGLIQEAVRLALSDSMIRSEFSLAKDLSLAEVDEAQIGQVIRGIALNAREAMPEGGVLRVRAVNVLRSASDHPSLPAGDYVQVSFEDQGPGIPSDLLPKIFDPYFSTKQRGSRKGMGLGLTICHSIIRKHAGAITVESAMGVGTSVIILLPAARMLSYGAKAPPRATIPPRQRLLIMTDEEAIRQAVGQTLSGMGHTVVWAQNGQTAIEKYKTTQQMDAQFEVVILALTVREGMGGLETLQALLQLDPGVKAIAMNGNVRDPELLEPGRHGFKAVLTKPFEAGKLREILARVLGTAPGERTFHE